MTHKDEIKMLKALLAHYELFDLDYAELQTEWEEEIEFRQYGLEKLLQSLNEQIQKHEKRGN